MRNVAIAIVSVLLLSCAAQDADRAAAAGNTIRAPASEAEFKNRIDDAVFEPYAKEQYPKLYSTLGAAMERAQPLREAAARQALKSGRCDRVSLSEIAEESTKYFLVAFVDCYNGERFYVNERDIELDMAVAPQSDRVIDRALAIDACAKAAAAAATFPALVEAHTWAGSSFSSNSKTGNALVRLNFEATNAFGVAIPYTANCIFPVGNHTPELAIEPRQL